MKNRRTGARRDGAARVGAGIVCACLALAGFAGGHARAGEADSQMVAPATVPGRGNAVIGALSPARPIHVEVALRMRNRAALDAFIAAMAKRDPAGASMTRERFLADHAPAQAQARAVADWLAGKGFHDVVIAPNRLLVSAVGSAGAARDAFATSFVQVRTHDGRIAFANTEAARVPVALRPIVLAVVGLQDVHVPHIVKPAASGMAAGQTVHDPIDFPAIYGAGSAPTGAGVTVGILTQGDLTQVFADLDQFVKNHGLPAVVRQTVDTGGTSTDTSGVLEWDLDSQSLLSMAGGRVGTMVFYNMPQLTDADMIADFNRVVVDNQARIISASMGGCELDDAAGNAAVAADQILAQAVAQGQTFAFASGDSGSDSCGTGPVSVGWPSNSPYVIAVGGTRLTTNGTTWSAETVWPGSGGGPSTYEPKPVWQTVAPGNKRGVPDIALEADPVSGAWIVVDGHARVIGGTSLATPLFAGFWARVIAARGTQVGFAGPALYGLPATDFHDITVGNNGGETAQVGYDYATGRGSPIIAQAIAHIAAGTTATPPTAEFSSATSGFTTAFHDASTAGAGTITSHAWAFGDGTSSSATNPSHTYAAAGVYEVMDVVRDSLGASAVKVHPVAIGKQVLGNPGFETGTAAPWNLTAGVLVNNAALAHAGSWHAAIGRGVAGAHTDHASHWVTVPAGITSATLSFYLQVASADTSGTEHDVLWLNVYDASNALVATPALYPNIYGGGLYTLRRIDMTPYIGKKVRIEFKGVNNASLQTTWHLDDVTVNAQ